MRHILIVVEKMRESVDMCKIKKIIQLGTYN